MKLNHSSIAFEPMFQHANVGIIISEPDGTITQVNTFANKLFGYTKDELIGKKIEILVPQKLRKKHVSHRAHYNQHPTPRSMGTDLDLWAVKKDGTEFAVEISLTHYKMGAKHEIVSFINDITERKKNAEELKKLNIVLETKVAERTQELSQALTELHHINKNLEGEIEKRKKIEKEIQVSLEKEKELSELKSRFVSMASHEFRTPLSGILTSTSLIGHYNSDNDAEKRKKHINTIKSSVFNLTHILDDFLSLDKLEHGNTEYRPSLFLLPELCQEICDELNTEYKDDERILYQHKSQNHEIFTDKNMLRNVLTNLLSNALKYSDAKKTVLLESEKNNSNWIIKVRDSGIGIPKKDQKHLFEKFFRANNAINIKGTGLGLHIVKRYLDLMKGSITFRSKENVGTTFIVTLPQEKHS